MRLRRRPVYDLRPDVGIDRRLDVRVAVAALLSAVGSGLVIGRFGPGYGAVLIALVLLGGIGLLGLTRPVWLVYGLIVVSPLVAYRQEFLGVNINLQRLILPAALVALMARYALSRPRSIALPPALQIFLVYLVYKTVGLGWSQKFAPSLRNLTGLLVGALVMFVISTEPDSSRRVRAGIRALIVSSLIPVAIATYQLVVYWAGGRPTLPLAGLFTPREVGDPRLTVGVSYVVSQSGEYVRVGGSLGGPAAFGEYIGSVLIILLAILVRRRVRPSKTPLYLAYASVLLTQLIFTFSRSAWIVFGLDLIVLVALVRDVRVAGRLMASAVMISVLFVYILALQLVPAGIMEERLLTVTDRSAFSADESLSEHVELRRDAIDVFLQSPLVGIGIGNFGARTGQGDELSSAHATFVTELAEGGVVGVALLMAFAVAVMKPVWRSRHRLSADHELRGAGIGLLIAVGGIFVNNLILYDTLLRDSTWPFLGLLIALSERQRSQGSGQLVDSKDGS